MIRTRPRGQPRTASGSRSAIARVVLFDTEWASRPAIVRLGHMQEVFLRETAVAWIRLRPASTVPSKAWLETKEQYVCQQAQRGRGRHQCRFGCRGSVQKPPKAARSCDRSQGRSNTQMSGSSCQEDGSGGAAARTSKKQSVNFDLPLSDSDRGKSTVDGFTLVVGRHKRLAQNVKSRCLSQVLF